MRRRRISHMEEDSLQADVMRFMAIVAFCLIAILAMVRNSPNAEETTVRSEPPPPIQTATAAPISEPEPEPERKPEPEPEPAAEIPEVHADLEPTIAAEPPGAPTVTSEPVDSGPVETNLTTAAENQGLTLRFASEADFMRLVSKGRITLYAYSGEAFLTTRDTYAFHTTPAPSEIYEIDIDTIPTRVTRAATLNTTLPSLQWGVGLSPRIQKQIRSYVDQNVSGELHINRYEQVLHAEAG